MSDDKRLTIEDKLGLLTYKNDHQSHIKVMDPQTCLNCAGKPCVTACPAMVYDWDAEKKKVLVAYENCIECGAARMLCPFNNIDWHPPRGGFGVNYKYG